MAKFDLSKTQEVQDLLQAEREQRDPAWRGRFYAAIVDASMATTRNQVIQGPDGFPYFVLQLPPAGQAFEPFCISHILAVCLDSGYGVVIQPEPHPPQWVFPYGQLWALKEFGKFEVEQACDVATGGADQSSTSGAASATASAATPATIPITTPVTTEDGRSVMVSQPSAVFLPPYARTVIKQCLAERTGQNDPQVLLVSDPRSVPSQSLVFSVFAEDFVSQEDFANVMYRLTWYLPRHYGLVSVPKDSEMARSFQPL